MECKEIIHLFSGGDYGIFCGAIVDRIVYGSSVLRIIIPDDRCNRSSYTDLGDPVAGWPSLVCILFGVGGVQLLCTGILGQYLAKTYLEVKNRPVYLLKDSSKEEQRIMMMPLSQNMRRKSYGKGKEVHSV